MLVVEKNGKTTVVTGWRAWLIAFGAVSGTVLVLALLAFLFLGIALTVGAILLVVLPAAIIVALISALASRRY